jgi:sarcosine oxidase subunit beta
MAELFPPLAHAQVIRFWSGVEGSLPDHQPVIGPSTRHPQLLHAFGFCGAGFQTGPAVGEALAELVHHGRAGVDLTPFSMARFGRSVPIAPDLSPTAAALRPQSPPVSQARPIEEITPP